MRALKAFLCLLSMLTSMDAKSLTEAPSPTYRLRSEDRNYVALISKSHLQVFKVIDAASKALRPYWESSFTEKRSLAGRLSDDGELIVVVSKFYDHENPVVWIYQKGSPVQALSGADLKVDRTKLHSTSGRAATWLAGSAQDSIRIDHDLETDERRVSIKATDGLTYIIIVNAESLAFFTTY